MNNPSALLGCTLDGKYLLEALVGKGGMGAVFRAVHQGTGRTVAVKVIAPELMDQGEYLERFRREAKAAGQLRHPNIVDLTDFGEALLEARPVAYLVMEYLHGWTLAEVLRQERELPLAWVLDLVEQVCAALGAAHARGIVHRDLKPENIWLEPDGRGGSRVKVLDFGLAKTGAARGSASPVAASAGIPELDPDATQRTPARQEELSTLTEVGTILGTPAYMSPEQCRGAGVDARSDLYSLGVVLFQVLAGQTPFTGTSRELLEAHIQARPPRLSELRRDLNPGIGLLVAATLAKDPGDRPESARQFLELFRTYTETGRIGLTKTFHLLVEQPSRFLLPTWLHLLPALALLVPVDLGLLGRSEPARGALPWLLPLWFLALFIGIAVNAVALAAITSKVVRSPLSVLPLSAAWAEPAIIGKNLAFRLQLLLPVVVFGLAFLVLERLRPAGLGRSAAVLLAMAGIGIGSLQFKASKAFPLVAPILALENPGTREALRRGLELLRPLDLRHQRNKLLQVLVPVAFYGFAAGIMLLCLVLPARLQPGSAMSSSFAVLFPVVTLVIGGLLPVTQAAMTLRCLQLIRLSEQTPAEEAQDPFRLRQPGGIRAIISGRPSWP